MAKSHEVREMFTRLKAFDDSERISRKLMALSRGESGESGYYMGEAATHIYALWILANDMRKALADIGATQEPSK